MGAGASSLCCALPDSACPSGSAGLPALSAWAPWDRGPVLLEPGSQVPPLPKRKGHSHLCLAPAGLTNWLLTNAPEGFGPPGLYRYGTSVCSELSPRRTFSNRNSGNLEASLPLLGFCPISLLSTFPSGKNPGQIFKVPTSPGLSFPVLEALAAPL